MEIKIALSSEDVQLIAQAVVAEIRKLPLVQPVAPDAEEFLTIDQAAKYLMLEKPTLYSLVSRRQIKSYKTGKRLFFKKADLTFYIESGSRKAVSEIHLPA